MKKLNASDFTHYTARAGDLVKGKGKGDMNTGATVILTAALLSGALLVLGFQTAVRLVSKGYQED